MNKTIAIVIMYFFSLNVNAQVIIDLSLKKGNSQTIDVKTTNARLINCSKNSIYIIDWEFQQARTPAFPSINGKDSKISCSNEVEVIEQKLNLSESEDSIKKYVDLGNKLIPNMKEADCIQLLKQTISETENIIGIPYVPLNNNQTITVKITKFAAEDLIKPIGSWTFILKTPEKTRWLIHYGLTYAPNAISKVDHYFSQADTSSTNKYTITKENDNGPKPWENISATINFTYPFHADARNFDGGFTAGFGLNAGFELSGHTGLSAVIGENVIIGTGVAFMQKYKLMGSYKENQVVKTNLNFESLHHKVWLPELYFTIGFRFNSNPFAKKAADDKSTKPPAEPAN